MIFRSRNTIGVCSPMNAEPQDLPKFQPGEFDTFEMAVELHEDIRVTRSGLCFKNSRLLPGCVQAHINKARIFEMTGRVELSNDPVIAMPASRTYLIVYHPWSSNYYHWITEAIPRIWAVRENLKEYTLVIPDDLAVIKFIHGTLECFKFREIIPVPAGHTLIIAKAVVPQIKPFCYSYNPKTLQETADYFRRLVRSSTLSEVGKFKRVYLVRGNSPRRRVVNEAEVVDELRGHGVASVDAAKYSFLQQVALFSNVDVLVSNGSGLTNVSFMKEGTCILDLHKVITNVDDFFERAFFHLASALNVRYFHQMCLPVDPDADMYVADFRVDIPVLRDNIQNMCSKC